MVFFKRALKFSLFFIELFQSHDLDRDFDKISRVGSTLIIRVIGLVMLTWINQNQFLMLFFFSFHSSIFNGL
jgi:hypothetical protein